MGPQTPSTGRKWQGQDSNPGGPGSKSTLATISPELNLPERAVWAEVSEHSKEGFQAWELQGGRSGDMTVADELQPPTPSRASAYGVDTPQ